MGLGAPGWPCAAIPYNPPGTALPITNNPSAASPWPLPLSATRSLIFAVVALISPESARHCSRSLSPAFAIFLNGTLVNPSFRTSISVITLTVAGLVLPGLAHAKRMGGGLKSRPAATQKAAPATPAKPAAAPAAAAPAATNTAAPAAAAPAAGGSSMMGTMGAAAVGAVAGTMAGSAMAGAMGGDKTKEEAAAKEAEAKKAEAEAADLQKKADEAKAKAEAARAVIK